MLLWHFLFNKIRVIGSSDINYINAGTSNLLRGGAFIKRDNSVSLMI